MNDDDRDTVRDLDPDRTLDPLDRLLWAAVGLVEEGDEAPGDRGRRA